MVLELPIIPKLMWFIAPMGKKKKEKKKAGHREGMSYRFGSKWEQFTIL